MTERKYTRTRRTDEPLIQWETPEQYVAGAIMEKGEQTFEATADQPEARTVGRYVIEDFEQGSVVVLGTEHIDKGMAPLDVGQYVEITFLGETQTKAGYPLKRFEVYEIQPE